ncbi:MAG: hypothetical protein JWO01_372 [Microbacteriaceae bacterium]|nr:hypothetical protein [Microbacteriaceae bacterium]
MPRQKRDIELALRSDLVLSLTRTQEVESLLEEFF